MKKKILGLLLCMTVIMSLLGTITVSADGGKISEKISKEKLKPGESFDVTVSIDSNPGIYALGFDIFYDRATFELDSTKEYTYGSCPLEVMMSPATATSICYYGDLASNFTNSKYTGVVLVAHLKVKAEATNGNYDFKLEVAPGNTIDCGDEANPGGNEIPFSGAVATVKVTGGKAATTASKEQSESLANAQDNTKGAVELGDDEGNNPQGGADSGTTGNADKKGSNTLLYVLIALLVVAIIAVVVVMFMKKSADTSASNSDEKPKDTDIPLDTPADEPKADDNDKKDE